MKVKLKNDNLAGRTMIQALFEELCQGDFTFYVAHDQNGRLTHLFFAHPSSIALTRSYTTVFVMDCTYKTNRYKMPLLDIIGVSSFNSSFYSCFVFLAKEGEEDYVWALQMFRRILGPACYPTVIVFDRELALMNAIKNEKEYMLSYIQRTWLPFKERFVKAWTEKCAYFGNHVSSRAEGAHGKLKKYLQVSTGDLHQVKNKICLAIENEFKEINAQLSSEKIRIPHNCNISFFKEIINRVSVYAMREILKQYEMVKHGTMQPVCTEHFMATMGLPCAHKMIDWKVGEVLKGLIHELEDKYEAWPPTQKERAQERISQLVNPSLPLLFEPNVQCPKGRPSGSKKGKESGSTRRIPSKFEIVDTTKRKCSICKGVGHNSRTCLQKFGTNEFNASHIANPNDDGPTMNVIDLHTISTSSNCFWLDD
ncbi:uncharacterized protein LOC131298728 [Rhododendron vialii]|uniref:uncharacterized protein LOC131298728 n=1 Tax=Rhododendron vialii TaxID=182163 RepID=UPI00265DCB5C|nr:uncharacterized protein LOC131298728 [Rhododendron vialii]